MLAVRSAKGLHRWTYYCIFGLLAVTGLRIGEALRLKHGDVDLGAGLLTIRDTKFGKSRLVPVHSTTVAVLTDYAKCRDALFSTPINPTLFVGEQGDRKRTRQNSRPYCTPRMQSSAWHKNIIT